MAEVLHRNDALAVLNKPAGISLLADRSGAPCLWDQLADLLGTKPYLVHRLDKPTSGVLVVALTADAQRRLTRDFQARRVRKFYLARTLGDPGDHGTIDLPLKKGRKSRYRVAGPRTAIVRTAHRWWLSGPIAANGHPSLTRFRRLALYGDDALLVLAPVTGRTHQLRVHLAWIGHPILGDHLYGKPDDPAQRAARFCLHAHRIVLPGDGMFTAPIGADFWEAAG